MSLYRTALGALASSPSLGVLRERGGQQGSGAVADKLLAAFTPSEEDAAVQYNLVGSLASFYMFWRMSGAMYWRSTLSGASPVTTGSKPIELADMRAVKLLHLVTTDTTPGVTQSGSWTVIPGNSYINNKAIRSTGTGSYAQIVTAPGATSVGAVGLVGASSGSVLLVTINGDAARAILLPTAQDLVGGGLLSASALITGGGTLHPTDRVWRSNGGVNNNLEPGTGAVVTFADDLSPDIHVVRITNTGYIATGATTSNITIHGIWYSGDAVPSLEETGAYPLGVNVANLTTSSEWPFAFNARPVGASNFEWMGHSASLALSADLVVTVDALPWTPTTRYEFRTGAVEFAQELTCSHSQVGVVAGAATRIGMHPAEGLTINYDFEWVTSGVVTGYSSMFPVNLATFDRFATPSGQGPLVQNDYTPAFNSDGNVAWCWKSDGSVAGMAYIPDPESTVNSWVDSGSLQLYWADRSDLKKAYAQRFGSAAFVPSTFSAGTTYRFMWFSGGADANVGGIL